MKTVISLDELHTPQERLELMDAAFPSFIGDQDDAHLVQRLFAKTDMPIGDFLTLFLLDEDCGLRFVRKINGQEVDVELSLIDKDTVRISIGVPR